MKRHVKFTTLLLAMVFLLSMTAGCSKSQEMQERTIRISISTSYGTLTSNIMKEYQLLEKYLPDYTTVEWKTMTSASDMRDALVAGELDVVCTSLPTFIAGYENGLPLALISFASSVPIGLYTNDSTVTSLNDFTEKDVLCAKSKGNNGHIAFLIACLEDLGDAMALDNQIATVQEADALGLLQTSTDYKASIFSFPMTVKAEEAGLYEVKSFNEIINAYGIGSTYFTRQDFYQDNADIINALRLAQAEAIGLIATDLEGVAETLSSIFELEPQHIVDAMKMCPPTPVYSGYDKLATLLYDIGLIDNTPTKFEDLFNYEDLDHE